MLKHFLTTVVHNEECVGRGRAVQGGDLAVRNGNPRRPKRVDDAFVQAQVALLGHALEFEARVDPNLAVVDVSHKGRGHFVDGGNVLKFGWSSQANATAPEQNRPPESSFRQRPSHFGRLRLARPFCRSFSEASSVCLVYSARPSVAFRVSKWSSSLLAGSMRWPILA